MEIICNHKYKSDLENIINSKKEMIFDFFNIDDVNTKIIVWDNKNDYKNNLLDSWKKQGCDREYQDYFIANTEDGNINMLSYELVTSLDDFKDYSLNEYLLNICHEFVHICQESIGSRSPGWFWEVIATNLGNPENQHETNSEFTLDDLYNRFDDIDGYGAVYKLGKHLFENYDKDFILSLIKDNNKLIEFEDKLIIKQK